VLAFVRGWTTALDHGAGAGAIRAQLRGLGAILFIVSEAGVWSFRPDDEVELSASPSPRLRREIDELAMRCGVPAGEDGVFVIDEHGRVRFGHAPCPELSSTLADALAAAGRELLGLRPRPGITRRDLAITSLVAGFGLVLLANCHGRGAERPAPTPGAPSGGTEIDVVLRINRQDRRLRIDARASLLDVLREQLSLTGTRKGCDHGQCGACTVLRDGRAVNACLTLAATAEGAEITTIEGLAKGDKLHPLQAAFIAHDAFQCGYCTSGQIMAGVALLHEGRAKSDDEVRQQMSGNICRCGAYPNIIAAIQAARKEV
jgi:xanthine dehydrogenase YagT iron-sulfur-binding subunit